MVSGFKLVFVGALVGGLHFGCDSDDEDRKMCESLCDFVSQCGDGSVDCSDTDTCVDNVEELGGACQSALKGFTDCWDEHPDCSSSECVEPAMKFTTECEGEL